MTYDDMREKRWASKPMKNGRRKGFERISSSCRVKVSLLRRSRANKNWSSWKCCAKVIVVSLLFFPHHGATLFVLVFITHILSAPLQLCHSSTRARSTIIYNRKKSSANIFCGSFTSHFHHCSHFFIYLRSTWVRFKENVWQRNFNCENALYSEQRLRIAKYISFWPLINVCWGLLLSLSFFSPPFN